MRKAVKKISAWMHGILILGLLFPFLYSLTSAVESREMWAYFIGYLVILPVVGTGLAIGKCKNMLLFFLLSIGILGVTTGLAYKIALTFIKQEGLPSSYGYVYVGLMVVFTLVLIGDRFWGRLNLKEKEETKKFEDPDWKPSHNVFEEPRVSYLLVFVVVYIVGANVLDPQLCNLALISGILYFFSAILFRFVHETEEYLQRNRTIVNLLGKRLYSISSFMIGLYLLLIGAFLVPTIFTGNLRPYQDLRERLSSQDNRYNGAQIEDEISPPFALDDSAFADGMNENGKVASLPAFLQYLPYVLFLGVAVVLIFVAYKVLKQMTKDFREGYDENGDFVEDLGMDKKAMQLKRRSKDLDSEREKIRRLYRKTIRKYQKEKPYAFQTPTEIEQTAKVEWNEEMMALHNQYEKLRYDRHIEKE